jgi:AcrR family transcriptional regulator
MKQEERERLLDLASTWMEASGNSFSVSALAKGTGVSRGRWYQVFDGKEELLKALFEERGVKTARNTRERLLDAMAALLKERELGTIRLEDIAEKAGTTTMTLFRLFGDRKGLFQAFSSERTPRQFANQLQWVPGVEPQEMLTSIVTRMLEFVLEYRGLMMSAFSSDQETLEQFQLLRSQPSTSRKALSALFQQWMEAGVMRQGCPENAVKLLVSAVLGMALTHREWEGMEVEARARFCVKTFWMGLQEQGEERSAQDAT